MPNSPFHFHANFMPIFMPNSFQIHANWITCVDPIPEPIPDGSASVAGSINALSEEDEISYSTDDQQ